MIVAFLLLLFGLVGCKDKSKKIQPNIILFYNGEIHEGNQLTVYYDGTPKYAPEAKFEYNGQYLDEFINISYMDEDSSFLRDPIKTGKYTVGYYFEGDKKYNQQEEVLI